MFRKLADPFTATRYHSLIVERKSLPRELTITAETTDGIIMGVRHRRHKLEGVQFHPESVLTDIRQTTPPKLPLPLTKSLLAKPHSNRPTLESIPTRHSERSRPTLFLRVHFL